MYSYSLPFTFSFARVFFPGLSENDVKLVLCELAHLHAASYHFLQTYPGGLDKFKSEFPDMNCKVWMINEDPVRIGRGEIGEEQNLLNLLFLPGG